LQWRAAAAKQGPEELLDYVGWLRADRQALRTALAADSGDGRAALAAWDTKAGGGLGPTRFDLALAVEMAGFAFETYNQPEGGRWEEGADGVKVAFTSDAFAASCYRGLLTVRDGLQALCAARQTGTTHPPMRARAHTRAVCLVAGLSLFVRFLVLLVARGPKVRLREADQLPRESMVEALAAGFTGGSGFNPFVMFALVEGSSDDALAASGLPASGVRGLARAFDVAQSSTSRARDYETSGGFGGLGKETFSRAFWGPSQDANGVADPTGKKAPPPAASKGSSSSGKDGKDVGLTGSGETFYLCVDMYRP
jgi:hypothetical protein